MLFRGRCNFPRLLPHLAVNVSRGPLRGDLLRPAVGLRGEFLAHADFDGERLGMLRTALAHDRRSAAAAA